MEAEQARELALNARLNHWPAHLGIRTDAQKIEHLATALDEAATCIDVNEADSERLLNLEAKVESLQEERDGLIDELNKLKEKLPK